MKKLAASVFASLLLTACGTSVITPGPYDDFARCLTDKGVKMYGADTCPHCKSQKAAFKGSFGKVSYVECTRDPKACQAAGIQAYPTWVIDGKKKEGETSLSALAELSGCPLIQKSSE